MVFSSPQRAPNYTQHQHCSPSSYRVPPPQPTLLVSLASPHIPDSGASHILLRSSSLPSLSHLFTPSPVPPISLSQANGDPLLATTGGTITFPFRPPILTYVSPTLAHNLWSVSALIGTDGTAQFTPTSVEFFSPLSPEPFLTGSKRVQDTLWSLLPLQPSSCLPSTLALYTPAQVPVIPNTGKNCLPYKFFRVIIFYPKTSPHLLLRLLTPVCPILLSSPPTLFLPPSRPSVPFPSLSSLLPRAYEM